MSDPVIRREEGGGRGRYVMALDGAEAELTFRTPSADLLIADHVGVPPAHRNRGLALRLVERLVADARVEGFAIRPLCPYVAQQRRRHPDWADVFEG